MKNSKHCQTPPLVEGDKTINEAKEKANIFNDFFASKATVESPDEQTP